MEKKTTRCCPVCNGEKMLYAGHDRLSKCFHCKGHGEVQNGKRN